MDPLSIAVGTLALAGIILALWAYPHLKDAFEEAFGDVIQVPDEWKGEATRKTLAGEDRATAGRLGKHDIAHRNGDVTP